MSAAPPQLRFRIGVIVERRKPVSPWSGDVLWAPFAVLAGSPAAQPWTPLSGEGEAARFYAGAAEIELYRTEVDHYRRNLASGSPSVWVALEITGSEPPCRIAAVTADPAEGEGFTEAGQAIVEAVAMPEALCDALAAFVAAYPAPPAFTKRERDRADPEALARRGPRFRGDR